MQASPGRGAAVFGPLLLWHHVQIMLFMQRINLYFFAPTLRCVVSLCFGLRPTACATNNKRPRQDRCVVPETDKIVLRRPRRSLAEI